MTATSTAEKIGPDLLGTIFFFFSFLGSHLKWGADEVRQLFISSPFLKVG